jgi:hypothetical protein
MWVGTVPGFSDDFERRESIYVLWNCNTAIRKTVGIGCCCMASWQKQNSNPSTKERSSTELRVSLRSSLDYEVVWRAVKGQDERQKTAPLTALHTTGVPAMSEKK